jgi:hypothetical protein
MVCCTWKNDVFGLYPSSNVCKNTTFRKMDLFPSSGIMMGAPTLLGPVELRLLFLKCATFPAFPAYVQVRYVRGKCKLTEIDFF